MASRELRATVPHATLAFGQGKLTPVRTRSLVVRAEQRTAESGLHEICCPSRYGRRCSSIVQESRDGRVENLLQSVISKACLAGRTPGWLDAGTDGECGWVSFERGCDSGEGERFWGGDSCSKLLL